MRYIITLSYAGTNLSGWQKQNNAATVQGELERALGILAGCPVETTGAGRTDAGVNAVNYVCHCDLHQPFPQTKPFFIHKINAILCKDIVVHDICPENEFLFRNTVLSPQHNEDTVPSLPGPCNHFAPDQEKDGLLHARFSAKEREYRYFIHRAKDPFCEKYSWRCMWELDMDRMNEACSHLLGEHDFSCFEKAGGNNRTSICTVYKAEWSHWKPSHVEMLGYPDDGSYLVFTIRADRFLRNMVRAIVGTMVEVGRGRMEPDEVEGLILRGRRNEAGESVPGHALFLEKIIY